MGAKKPIVHLAIVVARERASKFFFFRASLKDVKIERPKIKDRIKWNQE